VPELPAILGHPDFVRLRQHPRAVLETGLPGTRLYAREGELLVLGEEETSAYPLPQPSLVDYVRLRQDPLYLRPGRHADTWMENELGPFTFTEGRLLFGLKFYNAEGQSGVGGLGTFDLQSRSFELSHYLPMVDHAVSALHRDEAGDLWLGMANYPEGLPQGRGLLHFAPEQEQFTFYPFPYFVHAMESAGDVLYLGTDQGLGLFQAGELAFVEAYPAPGDQFSLRVSRHTLRGEDVTGMRTPPTQTLRRR